ncbi:Xylose isomerase-like, TIM barrel domain [Phaffia rhodozyma]|uniref:Xylose isomerase-like, TIM barrel domain n=1 Tax=Phaffia rhodozyma TaxID=264483 RepID=A0A0F7STA4_PHARH|nr:Xylose isomerase-like, TIM barrel domain [Phaffia rhodozyma]
MPPRPTRRASSAASRAIAASAAEATSYRSSSVSSVSSVSPSPEPSSSADLAPAPAKKRMARRKSKKLTPIVGTNDVEMNPPPSPTTASSLSDPATPSPPPKAASKTLAKHGKKRKSGDLEAGEEAAYVVDDKDMEDLLTVKKEEDEEEEEQTPKPKRARKKAAPQYQLGEDGEVLKGEDGNSMLKVKQPRGKGKEIVIHDVPVVEKLPTTFKGRLGYACLNSLLRNAKPPIFCSRTLRLKGFLNDNGMNRLVELTTQNTKDLITILEWNAKNGIRLFRLSSEMFPFASHKEHGYNIRETLPEAMKNMAEAGRIAKEHDMRITVHPGQWTQLASPTASVVENALLELDYQCDMLESMGIGKDGVMIIHMGGMYGDKQATLERFRENYPRCSEKVKQRLVLENDEICYSASDLLPVCDELKIPLVFDYHHDWINPSDLPPPLLMPFILKTWEPKGIRVKQHLSEARHGALTIMERRGHSDRCDRLPLALDESREITLRAIDEKKRREDAGETISEEESKLLGLQEGNPRHEALKPDILSEFGLRMGLPDDVDLMIEAKDKEQAVLHLFNLYNLGPVHRGSYLPPKPTPTFAESTDSGEDDGAVILDAEGHSVSATSGKPKLTPMAKAKKAKAKAKVEARQRREQKAADKEAAEEAAALADEDEDEDEDEKKPSVKSKKAVSTAKSKAKPSPKAKAKADVDPEIKTEIETKQSESPEKAKTTVKKPVAAKAKPKATPRAVPAKKRSKKETVKAEIEEEMDEEEKEDMLADAEVELEVAARVHAAGSESELSDQDSATG